MTTPILQVQNLVFKRGGRDILCDVSLRVNAGEFVALVGTNGSGKTSILKTALGILQPDSGRVSYFGRDLKCWEKAALGKIVSYCAQDNICHWPFTVEELVALGCERNPWYASDGGDKPNAEIAELLNTCGISSLGKQRFPSLSGGEKARTMLARALANKPRLLFADEPAAHLDPGAQLEVMQILKERCGNDSVLAVVHDINLAMRFADRIIALDRGKIVYDGPANQIEEAMILESCYRVPFKAIRSEGIGTLFVPVLRTQTAPRSPVA